MLTHYSTEVSKDTLSNSLKRLTNQTFRLLPMNEEKENWIKPLETVTLEVAGISGLFPWNENCFKLLTKLEGLRIENDSIDFQFFRRTIFECCSLFQTVEKELCGEGE